jgi:phosphonate transport system permease protein
MAPDALRGRPRILGTRVTVALLILLAGLFAARGAGLSFADLVAHPGGLALAGRFLGAALTPDLSSETLSLALEAAGTTVVFAAAAMTLALVLGVSLGFLASTAWWAGDPAGGEGRVSRLLRRTVLPTVYGVTRVLIAFLRSIHELLWAVLFAAAIGLHDLAAVVAIAVPYGGTLAKVFSEMADEAPRDTAEALRGAGASPLQVYVLGILPRALPDLTAYAFYRFECAIRSSAILGFFGYLTLGYHLEPAFQEGHYASTWTYLYAILLLVVIADAWSAALRQKAVA